MALLDDTLMLCSATALNTGAAGNYLIGSQIDTNTVRDLGNGCPVYLVVTVSTGITVASSTGDVSFRLASDNSASISTTITSSTQHLITPAYATSTTAIAAGTTLFACAIPLDGAKPYEQFIGILQVTGTTAVNAGAVNIYLTRDPSQFRYYPNGI